MGSDRIHAKWAPPRNMGISDRAEVYSFLSYRDAFERSLHSDVERRWFIEVLLQHAPQKQV